MGNRSKMPKRRKRVTARRTPAEHEARYQARAERERASIAKQKENLERYAAQRAAKAVTP